MRYFLVRERVPQPQWIARYLIGLVAFLVAIPSPAADWPMRGRNQSRNPVVEEDIAQIDWAFPRTTAPQKNIRWAAELGNVSHGDPVISGGLVWVGTNNDDRRPRDPLHKEDASVLLCFDERDGTFLYQYLSPRLPEGMAQDWDVSSQAGSPLIEGDKLWFCNNRCEVICLDIAALLARTGEPQVMWKLDMRAQLGVVPRGVMLGSNISQCSVAGYQDLIYVNTTNAKSYNKIPAPDAPSLICVEKPTGKVRWQDNSPGKNLIGVQHGNPLIAEINGHAQVIMGQGDGWVRGFDALTGEVLWKFDINPKRRALVEVPHGHVPDLVAMPVLHAGRVYFATGRHYEDNFGPGRLCCVDPTKRGDVSEELIDNTGQIEPNPNSGLVWQYYGASDKEEERMHCTLSSVAIHQGLVIVPDTTGVVHCLDAVTGKPIWTHNLYGALFGAPLIVGQTIYINTESGVELFALSREKRHLAERYGSNTFESSPVYANGVLYAMSRNRLYAIGK